MRWAAPARSARLRDGGVRFPAGVFIGYRKLPIAAHLLAESFAKFGDAQRLVVTATNKNAYTRTRNFKNYFLEQRRIHPAAAASLASQARLDPLEGLESRVRPPGACKAHN